MRRRSGAIAGGVKSSCEPAGAAGLVPVTTLRVREMIRVLARGSLRIGSGGVRSRSVADRADAHGHRLVLGRWTNEVVGYQVGCRAGRCQRSNDEASQQGFSAIHG